MTPRDAGDNYIFWEGRHPDMPMIGEGGEHLVYQEGPMVHKINSFLARQWLGGAITTDDVSAYVGEREQRHARMRNHFGKDVVPDECVDMSYMTLTREDCLRLAPEAEIDSGQDLLTLPLIIVSQPFQVELEQKESYRTYSISTGRYLERTPLAEIGREYYTRMLGALVLGQTPADYYDVQRNEPLDEFLALHRLPASSALLGKFHRDAAQYSRETGEILDLVGNFNAYTFTGLRDNEKPNTNLLMPYGQLKTQWSRLLPKPCCCSMILSIPI